MVDTEDDEELVVTELVEGELEVVTGVEEVDAVEEDEEIVVVELLEVTATYPPTAIITMTTRTMTIVAALLSALFVNLSCKDFQFFSNIANVI